MSSTIGRVWKTFVPSAPSTLSGAPPVYRPQNALLQRAPGIQPAAPGVYRPLHLSAQTYVSVQPKRAVPMPAMTSPPVSRAVRISPQSPSTGVDRTLRLQPSMLPWKPASGPAFQRHLGPLNSPALHLQRA